MPSYEPTVIIATSAEVIAQAIKLEYEIFLEAGYIKTNDQQEVQEYAPYNKVSDFFVVLEDGRIVGALRRVRSHPDLEFKTLTDFGPLDPTLENQIRKFLEDDAALVEEIGTVVVVKDKRGAGDRAISTGLYRAAWQDARRRGVILWLASMDERLFKVLNNHFQFGFQKLAEPLFYMGSQTVPGVLDIEKLHHEWLRGDKAFIGNYFLSGL